MASNWVTVPPRYRCEGGLITQPFDIPSTGVLELTIDTSACDGLANHVRYLEHVQVRIQFQSVAICFSAMKETEDNGERTCLTSFRFFEIALYLLLES